LKLVSVLLVLFVVSCFTVVASPAPALPASASWEPMALGSGGPWSDMTFTDADHGWVCGGDGSIIRTTDGGATWSAQLTLSGSSFAGMDVVSGRGWAVGRKIGSGGSAALIMHSSDGGASWAGYDESLLAAAPGALTGVDFVDTEHGWIWGAGGFWATEDGGATWAAVTSPGRYAHDIQFVGAYDGFAIADGQYGPVGWRTADGAQTWTAMARPPLYGWSSDSHLSFVDADQGFAFAGSDGLGVTSDGGASWTWRSTPFWGVHLAAVDARHIWALQEGVVWGTDDAGEHWFQRRPAGSVWDGGDEDLCILGERGWLLTSKAGARTALSGLGDMRPPVTTVLGPLFIDATTTYSASALDEGSGVASTTWRLDGGAWSSSPATISVPATQTQDTEHVIDCYSTDVYGNEEDVQQIEVVVDRAGPTVTFGALGQYRLGAWTNKPASVTLSGNDHQGIGATKVVVRLDGRAAASHPAPWVCEIKAPRTHTNDGAHAIKVYALDAFGHPGPSRTQTVRVDTRRPRVELPAKSYGKKGTSTIKFRVLDQRPCGGTYKATVRVLNAKGKTIASFDPRKTYAVGRAQTIRFTASITPGGYRIALTATDSAGNKQVAYGKLLMDAVKLVP